MGSRYLRRYVDLPALIYMLTNRKLSLLSPDSWDDGNDSHYLRQYRRKKNLKTVLAACFSEVDESYHHWHIFANGPSGVCVRFHRTPLLQAAKSHAGVHGRKVEYLTLAEMKRKDLAVEDLPFSKRYPYEAEREYRLIFESATERLGKVDVDFPLSSIERITLSPWMHPDLAGDVEVLLRRISGCSRLSIMRSTLIGNEEWKEYGESAA